MILGQISYLDCVVFVIFLAPQLLFNVNIFLLLFCVLRAFPFFCKSFIVLNIIVGLMLIIFSLSTSVWLHFREILHPKKTPISFCEASISFSRLCH